MNSLTTHLKPIYLTEEEALGALDLCLSSSAGMDTAKDRAILKLSELVRFYLSMHNDKKPEDSHQEIPLSSEITESAQILSSLLEFLADVPEQVMQDALTTADRTAHHTSSRKRMGFRFANSYGSALD